MDLDEIHRLTIQLTGGPPVSSRRYVGAKGSDKRVKAARELGNHGGELKNCGEQGRAAIRGLIDAVIAARRDFYADLNAQAELRSDSEPTT